MFWPGYLPDEFEYLRVVDYLVGGGGGEGGRGKEQQKALLLFNFQTTSPSLSPFPQARTKKKTQDYNILCSPLKRVASFLKIFSCRTRSLTERIASSFIKAVYLLRSTRRLLPKNLLAVRNYRI